MRVLIAGCGYVGTALGSELVKAGHEVWGLRRDVDASRTLSRSGIKSIVANLLRADELKDLPAVDTVVLCQAPSRKNDEYRTTYFDATKNLLDQFRVGAGSRLPAGRQVPLRKIILISSTSVYAVADGSWVDETTDPTSGSHADIESRENAQAMLGQERLVLDSGHPAVVFRLAGIYGPGRNRVKSILEGRIKPVSSDIYMNRIHLFDLVRGVRLLLERGQPGEIYLGSDDAPCTQREFYAWVFEKLSMALPNAGTIHGSFPHSHGSNKRVSNKKIKALGLKFRYPTYKEGYELLIAQALAESAGRDQTRRAEWLSR